jgi:hypothetical protein
MASFEVTTEVLGAKRLKYFRPCHQTQVTENMSLV